ncbi:MAG: GNAT family N-acetyltransferase [Nocardioidaceae bacterium]
MTHLSEPYRAIPSQHSDKSVLGVLERYYDTAPRADTTAEDLGPFTLFLRKDPTPWDYYARPRLGRPADAPVAAADLDRVRARQREAGAPEAFEWVHETTPGLLDAALAAGLAVERCPLLVLDAHRPVTPPPGVTVEVLDADSPRLGEVLAAVHSGFAGHDEVAPETRKDRLDRRRDLIRRGRTVTVGAYDEQGSVVAGGSHAPRGGTTELAGIAVLPRARRRGIGAAVTSALAADALDRGLETVFLSAQDDAVARVYERVGFARVGTACIAEPVEVQRLAGDDWALWRDLRLRALQDAPAAFGSTYERELGFDEDTWRGRLEDPGQVAVVARAGGTSVGMGAAFPDLPGWLHVVAMWVEPRWRGRRISHRVLDALRAAADERGMRLHLDVAVGNEAARASYLRYGFTPTGQTRPLREGPADTGGLVERLVLPEGAT